MKPIQVMFDEVLLAQLDADDQVKAKGRSAVLRQAAAVYLEHARQSSIARQYREAYSDTTELDEELAGWEEEGVWPSE